MLMAFLHYKEDRHDRGKAETSMRVLRLMKEEEHLKEEKLKIKARSRALTFRIY